MGAGCQPLLARLTDPDGPGRVRGEEGVRGRCLSAAHQPISGRSWPVNAGVRARGASSSRACRRWPDAARTLQLGREPPRLGPRSEAAAMLFPAPGSRPSSPPTARRSWSLPDGGPPEVVVAAQSRGAAGKRRPRNHIALSSVFSLPSTGSFISYYTMKDSRPLYTAAARLTKLRSAGGGCHGTVPFPAKGWTGRSSSVCRQCS